MPLSTAELQEMVTLAQQVGDEQAELEALEALDAQPSFAEEAVGIAETAATIGSAALAEPIAGVTGIAQAINPFAEEGAGAQAVEATREALTFNPRTEEGKANLQSIADNSVIQSITGALETAESTLGDAGFDIAGPVGGAIGEAIPTAILEATGLITAGQVARGARATQRAVAPAIQGGRELVESAFKIQSPTKQRIARLIKEGSTDVETARFRLAPGAQKAPAQPTRLQQFLDVGGPKVQADATAVETIRQGFDEGVIAAVKGSTRADKISLRKMVNIMERGKKNARFAATNRPSDVVGDTLLSRVKTIRTANRAAGKNIDKVAKSLKGQPVDLLDSVNSFADNLDDLGVRLVDDGKGGFKPDFEVSQLSPGDRGPIKEVIRQMNLAGRGQIDGLTAHKMKRIIDNNVTFGKTKTGISGDAERALKGFRTSIDDALDSTFPKYNQENVAYSETIRALNSLQDSVGKKLDFSGENADKALGTSLRGILSNNKSRINLLDSVGEIESVARKHSAGGKLLIEGKGLGSNDLLTQILFVDELDRFFGPVARTSFQGQIDQAVRRGGAAVASEQGAVSAGVDIAAKLAEKARGINDEAAFKSIKKLLRE